MKSKKLTLLLTVFTIVFIAQNTFAQKPHEDPRYGPDSASRMECVKNLSLYREFVKQGNYLDAISSWYEVFHSCPQATKNIYIDGVKIFRYLIEKEGDPIKQSEYIDTLMKVYDQRIQYFKMEGYVLGRKGVDYLRYRKDKIEDIQIGYNILEKSIELRKSKSEEAVMVTFMTATESVYKEAKIEKEKVVENYAMLLDIIEDILVKDQNDERALAARDNIDAIFERSGAATCDALVSLFKPKFEATPENIPLLEKITNLLDKTECQDDDLFFMASEKLHNLEPSSKSAAMVAEMCKKRDEYDKAIQYYKEAISLEENNITKSIYNLQIAEIYRKLEQFPTSRDFALKAIEENPSSGEAYILIGHLYAASKSCGVDDLTNSAIYWVAVDKYVKAKNVNPDLTEEANKYIATYSKYFPSKETIFFFSLTEGDTYKVECWINESTTVRIN